MRKLDESEFSIIKEKKLQIENFTLQIEPK
jgi:hypothetical protein